MFEMVFKISLADNGPKSPISTTVSLFSHHLRAQIEKMRWSQLIIVIYSSTY